MLHLVDFDRTLFDTDTFYTSLPDEPGCASFKDELAAVIAAGRDETLTGGEARIRVWQLASDAVRAGTLAFPPGYLSRFLYPDAKEFLRGLGNEAVIVTYGDAAFQKAKVESALADVVRTTVLYTGHSGKAEFLGSWPGYYGQEAIFVDDRVAELERVAERFPKMQLFRMRREGARVPPGTEGADESRWKVVGSLDELPAA